MKKMRSQLMEIVPGLVRTVSYHEGSTRGRWQATVNGTNYTVMGDIIPGGKFKFDYKHLDVVNAYLKKNGYAPVGGETVDVQKVDAPKPLVSDVVSVEEKPTFFGKVKNVIGYAKSVFGRSTPGSAADVLERPAVAPVHKPTPRSIHKVVKNPVASKPQPMQEFKFEFSAPGLNREDRQRAENARLREMNQLLDGHYVLPEGKRRVVRFRSIYSGEVQFMHNNIQYIGYRDGDTIKISRTIRNRNAVGKAMFRVGTKVKIHKD